MKEAKEMISDFMPGLRFGLGQMVRYIYGERKQYSDVKTIAGFSLNLSKKHYIVEDENGWPYLAGDSHVRPHHKMVLGKRYLFLEEGSLGAI